MSLYVCPLCAVQEKLDSLSGNREPTSSDRYHQELYEADPQTSKSFKSKLGAAGNKVSQSKASHKLRAQTSRIVSSFKAQQSVVSSIVRNFSGHKDGVWQVTTKTGQPIIGSASADHTCCIWGIESGRCLLQYQGHSGSVNSIKFHPTKDLVLTASGDGSAHIWQVNRQVLRNKKKGFFLLLISFALRNVKILMRKCFHT